MRPSYCISMIMLDKAQKVIANIARRTNEVLLFHSASGKDSICMLDLLAPHFKRVVCVFMYCVKDLSHINRYINWAKSRYRNIIFVQIPHPFVYSARKIGYMGCAKVEKQRQWSLAQLTDVIRERYSIDWAFYGFKQSDSMNRRVMLRSYGEMPICEETRKAYPLSEYKNSDILDYIEKNSLVRPESYGKGQSAGTNITDLGYLLFLRREYPNDLGKVLSEYPLVGRLLYEHDYEEAQRKPAEGD